MELNKIVPVVSELIKKFHALEIVTDQIGSALFILYALKHKDTNALNVFTSELTDKRAGLLLKELEFKKIIELDNDIRLTAIGNDLVDWVDSQYMPSNVEAVETPFIVKQEKETDWVEEYIELWPVQSKEGIHLRGDKKGIYKKLEAFFKDYPEYTKQDVFKATKKYLSEREEYDFAYTKKASNFISQTDLGPGRHKESMLASYCEHLDKKETVKPNEDIISWDDFIG